MSYFNDWVQISEQLSITRNGVTTYLPETSEPVSIEYQNISDGGRLADNIDYQGSLKGVKRVIELHYAYLNKEHYDILFAATQGAYNSGEPFFFDITFPTYTPDGNKEEGVVTEGLLTLTVYFESTHKPNAVDSTEKHELDSSYWRGGQNYDVLYQDVTFKFIQK